jgi:hypothetical protein
MPFQITAEEIAKTESKLGVVFPSGFKAKMSVNNGGELEAADDSWDLIPFLDTSDKKRIARTCNDIISETKSAREWAEFPDNGYAVATNASGDFLVLLPLEVDPKQLDETIYHWNHETGELVEVAHSLVELRR